MSTAQKVRLWFMLAALILGFIFLLYAAVQPAQVSAATNTVLMSQSSWNDQVAALSISFIAIVTLMILGPITLYRFLHPKVQAPASTVPPYNPAPQQAAYLQNQFQHGDGNWSQSPYPTQNPYPPYGQ